MSDKLSPNAVEFVRRIDRDSETDEDLMKDLDGLKKLSQAEKDYFLVSAAIRGRNDLAEKLCDKGAKVDKETIENIDSEIMKGILERCGKKAKKRKSRRGKGRGKLTRRTRSKRQ